MENPKTDNTTYIKWDDRVLQLSASFEVLNNRKTRVIFSLVNPVALLDPFGNSEKWWRERFGPLTVLLQDIEKKVLDGLMYPACGKELPSGAQFCPNDGSAITANCSKCGHGNTPDSQFCLKMWRETITPLVVNLLLS